MRAFFATIYSLFFFIAVRRRYLGATIFGLRQLSVNSGPSVAVRTSVFYPCLRCLAYNNSTVSHGAVAVFWAK